MNREQIKKIVKLTEAIVNKRLNESAPDPYSESWIPYKNINGDSENTILRDYMKIINSCDDLIQAISTAESLYHGRNATNSEHQSRMVTFKKLNISEIRDIQNTYTNSLKEFQQINNR